MATYEDGIARASLPLLQKSILAWAIRSRAAPNRSSIRADAFAGVARARFTLQLTLGLVPKLRLMALAVALLHRELVGTLSYPVLCLIGMLFHITVLPSFPSRRIRRKDSELLRTGRKYYQIKLEVFLHIIFTENVYDA
jgi:hypothetical protein